MRLDYLTIFPEFFDVLGISLLGKAVDNGIIDIHAHDLRTWTHDRHRTVDDPLWRWSGHGHETRSVGGGIRRPARS